MSERRARSIRTILIGLGINRSRIEVIGYGEMRPIASNRSREGRARNRRAEIIVIPGNGPTS